MKKLILALTIALASLQTFAWWPTQAYVSYNRTLVSASVYNHYGRPIICNANVYGRTMYGNVFNGAMWNQVIWPGQYAYAYVYSGYADPFIGGWANAHCTWYY